jgi:hypothetical protein
MNRFVRAVLIILLIGLIVFVLYIGSPLGIRQVPAEQDDRRGKHDRDFVVNGLRSLT